jgi:hypothetical protein
MTSNLTKFILLGVASTAMATLVGCGGGNSETVYGLTGVAATGVAIKEAKVEVKCVSGSPTSTTTSATGFYGVAITNGVGPCLVKVSQPGKEPLYSITPPGSTGSAIANVNPISDAIVKALVASKGSGTFDMLVTSKFAPTTANLKDAVAKVLIAINALLPANLQLLPGTELLSDPAFKAATSNGASDGSTLDKALDFLVLPGATSLSDALITSINSAVASAVNPNATGSTGSTGSSGSSGNLN